MEKLTLTKVIEVLDDIIQTYGGVSSLANPHVIIRIQEELRWLFPQIPDILMDKARGYMNNRKPKAY